MLASGDPMFLMLPDPTNEKVLHPGEVLTSTPEAFEAAIEAPIAPRVGEELNVYAEVSGKFFQQSARLTAIREEGEKRTFAFARVGQAVSADQRRNYRISSVTTGIVARIGAEERCPVLDISSEGFGAIVQRRYEVGSLVKVLLRFWNEDLLADICVQTVQARPDGKFRCGFLAVEKNSPARVALQKLSSSLHRSQLYHFAGAA
jgi:hypothetical protein